MGLFLYAFYLVNIGQIALFAFATFSVSFLITQFRVEKFIYKRINKIYKDLTLLEAVSFSKKSITTDMATLTKQIDQYAKNKKLAKTKN